MSSRSSKPGRGVRSPKGVGRWAVLVAGGLLASGLIWLGPRLLRSYRLHWAFGQGVAALALTERMAERAAALDRWEERTGRYWVDQRMRFAEYVLDSRDLRQPGVREVLARVAGADYGDRADDWKRWLENRRRLRAGRGPRVSAKQAVKLKERWRAPIGRTADFSTILPIDGQIYVASLGQSGRDVHDASDGVVRMDGASGRSELWFRSPGRAPRDVIGIAAGDDVLFVAARNGQVHCIDRGGELRWSAAAGGPIVSPPLAIDYNRNGVTDVVVFTARHKAVAFSGASGHTDWVANVPRRGRLAARLAHSAPTVAARFSVCKLGDRGAPLLVLSTQSGSWCLLNAADGRILRAATIDAGFTAGPVCVGGGDGPLGFVADRLGRVWSLVRTGRRAELINEWMLMQPAGAAGVRGLCILTAEREGPASVAACSGGALHLLTPSGPAWRFSVGGLVRSAPAVADLNGDGQREFVVASIIANEQGRPSGLLSVVSHDGHLLRRVRFDHPLTSSPVIADVDGDGLLEVLVADRAGYLHCFATERAGPVEWGVVGGDVRNTRNAANAYTWGQVPHGFQWAWQPEN